MYRVEYNALNNSCDMPGDFVPDNVRAKGGELCPACAANKPHSWVTHDKNVRESRFGVIAIDKPAPAPFPLLEGVPADLTPIPVTDDDLARAVAILCSEPNGTICPAKFAAFVQKVVQQYPIRYGL